MTEFIYTLCIFVKPLHNLDIIFGGGNQVLQVKSLHPLVMFSENFFMCSKWSVSFTSQHKQNGAELHGKDEYDRVSQIIHCFTSIKQMLAFQSTMTCIAFKCKQRINVERIYLVHNYIVRSYSGVIVLTNTALRTINTA